MKLKILMTYKGVIIYLYDFKKNYEFFLIFNFYMIILCFGMVLVIIQMNKILWEKFQELYDSNVFISKNLNRIFNAMKTPLISLNYEKNEIHFNIAFHKFLKENYPDDLGIKFLLNEIQEDKLHKEYINSLMNNISKEDHILLKKQSFTINKTRILIINKILSEFFSIYEFNKKTVFNIFDLLLSNKQFDENEYFELLGEFKLKSIHHEKFVQISWKKSINNTEDRIDIMLNDITILKEAQFTKAETKYKNIYLAKVAHEFKTPINSLIYSVNELFEKFPQIKESKDEKIKKQVEFIHSQSNFITILIHDINDYCKDVKDLDINLEYIEIRVVINFAFEILRCLLSKDQYKKDNVKIDLNISDNVPLFITTDEKRLKQ